MRTLFILLLCCLSVFGQGTPNFVKGPWSTNVAGTPVQGQDNLSVTNLGSGSNWLFYTVGPKTVARLGDVTNVVNAIGGGSGGGESNATYLVLKTTNSLPNSFRLLSDMATILQLTNGADIIHRVSDSISNWGRFSTNVIASQIAASNANYILAQAGNGNGISLTNSIGRGTHFSVDGQLRIGSDPITIDDIGGVATIGGGSSILLSGPVAITDAQTNWSDLDVAGAFTAWGGATVIGGLSTDQIDVSAGGSFGDGTKFTYVTASKLAAFTSNQLLTNSTYSDTDIANLQGATNGLTSRLTTDEGATNSFVKIQSGFANSLTSTGLTVLSTIGGTANVLAVKDTNSNVAFQTKTNNPSVVILGTNSNGWLSISNNASVTNSSLQSGGNAPTLSIGAGGEIGIGTNQANQALFVVGNAVITGNITNSGTLSKISSVVLTSGAIQLSANNKTIQFGSGGPSMGGAGNNYYMNAGDGDGRAWITLTNQGSGGAAANGTMGVMTNSPFATLHVRQNQTNAVARFDSGIGPIADIKTNNSQFYTPILAPTNAALITTIAPANLHSVTLGKGWTNDLGARATLVLQVKFSDAATGDPSFSYTNTATGEGWTNGIAFGLTATTTANIVIPLLSTNDYGSFTDLSGAGASVTILQAWWKLQ